MRQQCSLCNSLDTEIVFRPRLKNKAKLKKINFSPTSPDFGIFYDLARCKKCRMLFALLDNKAPDIQSLYSQEDDLYLTQAPERNITNQKILSHLKTFVPYGARLLDIGCSYGFFLQLASREGFKAYGIEVNKDAYQYCKDTQGLLNVFYGDLKQADFPENYFDVITAIEVIEHIRDIKDFICDIHRVLKPGGILYLVTPDIKSLSGRLMGFRFWSYRGMHLHYFSKKTLYKFLDRNGFSVICSSSYKKTFKINYIIHQLYRSAYNKIFYYFLLGLSNILRIKNICITMSFGDIAVTARKL